MHHRVRGGLEDGLPNAVADNRGQGDGSSHHTGPACTPASATVEAGPRSRRKRVRDHGRVLASYLPGFGLLDRGRLCLTLLTAILWGGCASSGCQRESTQPDQNIEPAKGERGEASVELRRAMAGILLEQADAVARTPEAIMHRHARGQNWWGVLRVLDGAPQKVRKDPANEFLCAFASVELEGKARALDCLEGLEARLPNHAKAVTRLRHAAHDLSDGPLVATGRLIPKRSAARPAAAPPSPGVVQASAAGVERSAAAGVSSKVDSASKSAALIAVESASRGELIRRARRHARSGEVAELELTLTALDTLPSSEADILEPGAVEHLRGRALYEARRYDDALTWLDRSARSGSEFAREDQFRHARALARADQNDASIAAFRQFIIDHPDSTLVPRARYLAARLAFIMARWDEAITGYDEMRRLGDKGRRIAYYPYERAVSLLAAGRHGPALEALEELLKGRIHDRERGRLRQLMGVAALGLGKKQQAIDIWQDVVAQRPYSLAAQFARMRLSRLGIESPTPARVPAVAGGDAPRIPEDLQMMVDLGLHQYAEEELSRREREWTKGLEEDAAGRVRCATYGSLDVAQQQFQTGLQIARRRGLVGEGSWGAGGSLEPAWLARCIHPRAHSALVARAERDWKLPRHLVHAVMMAESAFRPSIVSSAKAVGLMQLINPTATKVAAELGVQYDPRLLERPAYNIGFGAHYLSVLSEIWDGNLPLMIASYNAGPKAVSRWMETGENLDLDVFVARIPYGQTRGYVYRVWTNFRYYAAVYGESSDGSQLALEFSLPKGRRAPADAY